jgi:catechol 2,3-dioxygenase-like lactoylglutathione lyase family enzyme
VTAHKKAPFTLGTVGHIALAVRDPKASAAWYVANLGLREEFEFEGGVAVGSDGITFAFFRGTPAPDSIEHISFHLPDVATLRAALAYLQGNGVELEDPGDEIGPEAPGSPNVGIWLHDPDGYRLELNVQGGAAEL